MVAASQALRERRMSALGTPTTLRYIDPHPVAVSGVESTNDTVVTLV